MYVTILVIVGMSLMALLRGTLTLVRARTLPLASRRGLAAAVALYTLCGAVAGDWMLGMVRGLTGHEPAPGLFHALSGLGLSISFSAIETLHMLGIVGFAAFTLLLNRVETKFPPTQEG